MGLSSRFPTLRVHSGAEYERQATHRSGPGVRLAKHHAEAATPFSYQQKGVAPSWQSPLSKGTTRPR